MDQMHAIVQPITPSIDLKLVANVPPLHGKLGKVELEDWYVESATLREAVADRITKVLERYWRTEDWPPSRFLVGVHITTGLRSYECFEVLMDPAQKNGAEHPVLLVKSGRRLNRIRGGDIGALVNFTWMRKRGIGYYIQSEPHFLSVTG